MSTDPFELFDSWYREARESEPNDSNAMTLATVSSTGQPSARMVLLKGHGPDGFVFYTNRESRKAHELGEGARAESDAYFATRGRDSQLGAWASDQSRPLADRETFKARFEAAKARFEGGDVPRPPHWGGFRVTPSRIEFWQDRAHRLHERRLFTHTVTGWSEGLLYP
jgi:pyridoxamine 5'-phosphate oxidase